MVVMIKIDFALVELLRKIVVKIIIIKFIYLLVVRFLLLI